MTVQYIFIFIIKSYTKYCKKHKNIEHKSIEENTKTNMLHQDFLCNHSNSLTTIGVSTSSIDYPTIYSQLSALESSQCLVYTSIVLLRLCISI